IQENILFSLFVPDDSASRRRSAIRNHISDTFISMQSVNCGLAQVLGNKFNEPITTWFDERLQDIGNRLRALGYYYHQTKQRLLYTDMTNKLNDLVAYDKIR